MPHSTWPVSWPLENRKEKAEAWSPSRQYPGVGQAGESNLESARRSPLRERKRKTFQANELFLRHAAAHVISNQWNIACTLTPTPQRHFETRTLLSRSVCCHSLLLPGFQLHLAHLFVASVYRRWTHCFRCTSRRWWFPDCGAG